MKQKNANSNVVQTLKALPRRFNEVDITEMPVAEFRQLCFRFMADTEVRQKNLVNNSAIIALCLEELCRERGIAIDDIINAAVLEPEELKNKKKEEGGTVE